MTSGEAVVNKLHVWWARSLHLLGWHGMAGIGMLASGLFLIDAGRRMGDEQNGARSTGPQTIVAESRTPDTAALRRVALPLLPASANVPTLLKDMKTSTLAAGLTWPTANYQYVPLTGDNLATLEIQTTLKGPYIKIKQAVAAMLHEQPAMAMRELTITRPNVDTSDVEAKVRWAVFLSDNWPLGIQATPGQQPAGVRP